MYKSTKPKLLRNPYFIGELALIAFFGTQGIVYHNWKDFIVVGLAGMFMVLMILSKRKKP